MEYSLINVGIVPKIFLDPKELNSLSHLIIPGIGFMKSITKEIDSILHLREEIRQFYNSGKPILGICLGMQLLGSNSEEDKTAKCLDFLSFDTRKLSHLIFSNSVPHIGWNQVNYSATSSIFSGIEDGTDFYFSHSFAVLKSECMIASTEYEIKFASALNYENLFGVQFHPERSQDAGIRLLQNFSNLS